MYIDEYNIYNYKNKRLQKILDEYPDNEEHISCSRCGETLAYDSMSYHEGYHIDGCE